MKMESEKRYLICALQASLLENHKVRYENIYDMFCQTLKSLQYVEYDITWIHYEQIKASRRAAEVKTEATPSIYNHQDTTQKPPDNDSDGCNTSSTIEVMNSVNISSARFW